MQESGKLQSAIRHLHFNVFLKEHKQPELAGYTAIIIAGTCNSFAARRYRLCFIKPAFRTFG
jgi:hypothetical protein